MKTLVLLLAALGCSLFVCSGQEISIVILPIVDPVQTVSVTFDGSKLTSQRGDKDPMIHRLTLAATGKIRKAISSSPQEQWAGHWGSTAFLDGYEIVAEIKQDGKKLKFSGSNGCPPGFSKLAKAIHEATKLDVLRSGWSKMEESSKQYKSRVDFFGSILEAAKTKRDEGSADQHATAEDSKAKGNEKPKPESEGRSR